MKFGLVLWANSGDSDPGQNPLQKQERERFLWSPKKCFSNLIPWMSVHLGLGNLNSLVSGNGGILCTGLRAPKFDGSRGLLMFKHL